MADAEELGKIQDSLKKIEKVTDRVNNNIDLLIGKTGNVAKEFKKTEKAVDGVKDAVKKAADAGTNFQAEINDAESSILGLSKKVKEIHMEKGFNADVVKKFSAHTDDLEAKIKNLKAMSSSGIVSSEKIKEHVEEIKKLTQASKEVGLEIDIAANNTAGWSFGQVKKGAGDIKSAFAAMKGGNMKSLSDSAAKFGKKSKDMINMGNAMKAAGGSAGKAAGLVKGFGKALGGLAKAIPVVGQLLMVFEMFAKIISVANKANKFVKDANKNFQAVRGPDLDTKDVVGQFEQWNEQVYDFRQNLRDAVDSDAINAFAGAISVTGKNLADMSLGLSGTKKGFGTYRDAIHIASKASKTLGMDMSYTGAMMGKMMVEFKMDLEQVDKAFVNVAFDAKRAGLSTDKFWGVVQNASASLSLYGNFVSAASRTMKTFAESSVGSAEDAGKATQDMFNVFKSGSIGAQASILQFAEKGGVSIKKEFLDIAKEFGARKSKIEAEIKVLGGKNQTQAVVDKIDKLKKETYELKRQQDNANKAAHGDAVTQQAMMGMLSGRAQKILMGNLKGMNNGKSLANMGLQQLQVLIESAKSQNISADSVRMLVGLTKNTKTALTESKDELSKIASGTKEAKKLAREMNGIEKLSGDDQAAAGEKLAEGLRSLGMQGETEIRTIIDMAKGSKEGAGLLQSILKTSASDKGGKRRETLLKKLENNGRLADKTAMSLSSNAEKTEKQLAEKSETMLDKIANETLSFDDIAKMAKESGSYEMASLGLFKTINTAVNMLARDAFGGDSAEAKQAEVNLEKRGITDLSGAAAMAETDKLLALQGEQKTLEDIASALTIGDPKVANKVLVDAYAQGMDNLQAAIKDGDATGIKIEKANLKTLSTTLGGVIKGKDGKDIDLGQQLFKALEREKVDTGAIRAGTGLLTKEKVREKQDSTSGLARKKAKQVKVQSGIVSDYATMGGTKQAVEMSREKEKRRQALLQKAATSHELNPKVEANLRTAEIITSPGMVRLDAGEMMMPNSKLKSVPADAAGGAGGGTGGAGGGVTNNWNITATETNLADKIANKVREIAYKDKIRTT